MRNILTTIFINPSDANLANVNGLDYIRNNYEFFYGSLELDINGNVIEDTVTVGIRSKYGVEYIKSPVYINNYSDGTTQFETLNSLITYLSGIFGLSNNSVISQSVSTYSNLSEGSSMGQLAYVSESSGTSWLPFDLGGTYRPKGIYIWNGTQWVSDRNAIAAQLESNIIALSELDDRITNLEELQGDTYESVSKNLKSYPYVLSFTGSDLTSITYDLGLGQSITKTLNYTGSDLTSVVLSGDTPTGINLTKTLGYTNGNLTSITYS